MVGNVVLPADEHAGGPIRSPGEGGEEAGLPRDGLRPPPGDMVQAQVELVVGELLGGLTGGLLGAVGVGICVRELEGREDRVVEPYVNSLYVKGNGAALVGLEGGRNGRATGAVAVHDVHELLLLDRGDHDSPSLGLSGDVLPRDHLQAGRSEAKGREAELESQHIACRENVPSSGALCHAHPADPSLPKHLALNLEHGVPLGPALEPEQGNGARVRRDDNLVTLGTLHPVIVDGTDRGKGLGR